MDEGRGGGTGALELGSGGGCGGWGGAEFRLGKVGGGLEAWGGSGGALDAGAALGGSGGGREKGACDVSLGGGGGGTGPRLGVGGTLR